MALPMINVLVPTKKLCGEIFMRRTKLIIARISIFKNPNRFFKLIIDVISIKKYYSISILSSFFSFTSGQPSKN